MLPVLLLVVLGSCRAQGPSQRAGSGRNTPVPALPGYQHGISNDAAPEWVENVPQFNSQDILYGRAGASPNTRIALSPNVDKSGIDIEKMKAIITALEFPDTLQNQGSGKSPGLSSAFSQFVRNITLSENSSVKDHVTNMANLHNALWNDTNQLMGQLNMLYLNLAIDQTDNEITMGNYGISLILRFLFEFYRIFRKLSAHPTNENIDVYGISYDRAIDVLKEKRSYSPLEISAPLIRSLDIFKSIMYESVIIVQTKCRALEPNWKCVLVYLTNVLSETTNCSNIWYHALVHMLALESIDVQNSFVYSIGNLERFKDLIYFDNVFDFIVEQIKEYKNVGRVQLSAEAVFFIMLVDLQENGLLDCLAVDYSYN